MEALKRRFKIPLRLKDQKATFYDGIRGYRYYKKRWETQLDEFNIEHTEKEIRQLALQDYFNAKGRLALLITLYIMLILLLIAASVKPVSFLIEQMKNSISYVRTNLSEVSSDAWLGFWGSVLGSIVTMLGIIITIRFERKKDELSRKQQAQPILMLQHRKRDDAQTQSDYKSSYDINFCSYKGDELGYDKFELQLPDIILRNVGFNAAINIDLLFEIDGWKSQSGSELDYLPSNEYEAIKTVVEFYKQEIDKIFNNIQYRKKSDAGIIHAYFAIAYSKLKREFHDKIKFVAGKNGKLTIKYQDVYGNEYYHYYGLGFYLVGLDDNTFTSFMTYPTYSRKIKPIKK